MKTDGLLIVHPLKDQLIAFGQGKLAADESSSVEQHLEVCRECCDTLLDLKDDTFIGLMKISQLSDSDRRMGTLARPATESGKTESDKTGTGKSVHPTEGGIANDDAHSATMLVQSGEMVSIDDLPAELQDHPRYRIVELIGRGGMGNVYRAEHRLMNRPVAIKLINSQLIRQPQAVERFRREVQAAAKLTHPNIVTAYDAEQAGDVHFLVMEFVEGTDLASVVKHRGPMSVAEACECIRQVAEGLQHAHEKGMVHRDIKPHNLMLSAEGQVRILDFGLAGFTLECGDESPPSLPLIARETRENKKEIEGGDAAPHSKGHLTMAGSVMGTPDYIAPEQAKDAHSADIRADIYSLGCTLHFLLTGKPPFVADNIIAKLKAHAESVPEPLTKLRGDVPQELSKIVARMMAKQPAERFQTPAAVAEALAPFAKPAASPPRRRISRAIATAFLFAALILAAVVIYVQTDTGQFEIQATDEVVVLIEQSKLKIRDKVTGRDYQLTAGKHSIRKGEYVVNVTELPDGVTVDTDKFSLTRGGEARVTVSFKPKESSAPKTVREESPSVVGTDLVDAGRFTGHEGSVSHAIVSPGGRYGISCGADKTIRVWDIATQEEKRVLKGHEESVYCLAISADGKLLASGDKAKSIRLWNLETGEQLGELTGHTEAVTDLAFMPDRSHLLSAGFDDTLRLWHVADRKLVKTIDIGTKVEKMIPLLDGRRVMLSGAHTRGWGPTTYDLEKGEKIDATPNAYSCMAVSADGRMLLIGSITGVLVVRDTVNEKVIVQMTDPRAKVARDAAIRDAAITPDGRFAITTTREHQMHLWDLHGGKLLSSAEGKTIGTISLSPDGRFALTIGREGGVGVWRLPESVLEPIGGHGDAKRLQGTPLTPANPAAPANAPAPGVGVNLLLDSSFENTAPTLLPRGWSSWLDDGPDFRCEVVNGGHTGERSLQITGKGTRGVVFANSVPLDRSKRYALKGWAKFEGDKDTRAIIKFNYFHNGKWLGVHDLVGVTADQPGWHLLEKTDAAEAYPEATLLVPTCHVEGNGTGWFDDLELIAYDRDKLPANFEAMHGKNNRQIASLDFDRWVGEWDATFEVKPNAQSPQDRNTRGTMTTRKVLDDRFLLTHSANESDPTQWLWFLTHDANFAAYRIWIFGSGGEAFERRGQWDAASQMLSLQLVPPSPGVTGQSTDRFIGNDQIESTLFVKSAEGQVTRDNRWSAKKKTPQPKSLAEIPSVAAPAPLPEELSLLNKFAGDWTIRAKSKPSIWLPNGGEETQIEKVAWILGGRFLMARTYDEKDQLTSIWLATYEPSEKSNRFWFFNADGSSGQWRVTWDAASRGFHWRSIDMPTGWIGTGFNRWINDDTFDNQALIKDENGRVLLDGTQDKRRKK